ASRTAESAGDGDAVVTAVPAAVAVELVHDFSVLHDDVMDGDRTRRHRPAAWTLFGTGTAVLAGDTLLITAIQQLADGPTPEGVGVLVAAVSEMCAGQASDLAFETRTDVSVPECLTMAEAKTGALMGAACQLGAMASGADRDTAHGYRVFGRQLGLAFQLVDDLLGIWGDPQVSGKPVGADLAARKRSLPVVAALTSGTKAGDLLAQMYASTGDFDQTAVTRAAELVEASGGRAWAQAEAERRTREARQALAAIRPAPGGAEELATLTALMVGRRR
ncbi:polyprenyl synthetase family protein, partial [Streptosporangium algeriense]